MDLRGALHGLNGLTIPNKKEVAFRNLHYFPAIIIQLDFNVVDLDFFTGRLTSIKINMADPTIQIQVWSYQGDGFAVAATFGFSEVSCAYKQQVMKQKINNNENIFAAAVFIVCFIYFYLIIIQQSRQ